MNIPQDQNEPTSGVRCPLVDEPLEKSLFVSVLFTCGDEIH